MSLDCVYLILISGSPGVLGIWGERLFIFRELGSTGNYFQEFGEQAHSFWDLGSPEKVMKKIRLKGKAFISFDFFKKILRPPDPLGNLNVFATVLTC